MFDIGYQELLIIGVVAIIVVGPKDLPGLLRSVGKTVSKARSMAGEFKSHFDEIADQEEFKEIRKSIDTVKDLSPSTHIKKAMSPFEDAGNSITDSFNSLDDTSTSTKPTADTTKPTKKTTRKTPKKKAAPKAKKAKLSPVKKAAKKTAIKKPAAKKPSKTTEKARA